MADAGDYKPCKIPASALEAWPAGIAAPKSVGGIGQNEEPGLRRPAAKLVRLEASLLDILTPFRAWDDAGRSLAGPSCVQAYNLPAYRTFS